jgi:hypothetical protein
LIPSHSRREIRFDVSQWSPRYVARRDDFDRYRPTNTELRIIVSKTAFAAWSVSLAHQVRNFRIVFECNEAVREPLRDINATTILGGEVECHVLKISRRFWTQVDDNVKYGSLRTSHVFGFRMRRILKVQAA